MNEVMHQIYGAFLRGFEPHIYYPVFSDFSYIQWRTPSPVSIDRQSYVSIWYCGEVADEFMRTYGQMTKHDRRVNDTCCYTNK